MEKSVQFEKSLGLDNDYENKVHAIGRLSLFIGLAGTFLIPLTLWFGFGLLPTKQGLINGFIGISAMMAPVALAQLISYAPVLGSSAMYMAYLTGNLANLKIPSAAVAMENAEVEASSDEGDIISTVAVASSVIVSEVLIIIGVLAMIPLTPIINAPVLQPAFKEIVAALFGAVGFTFIMKDWKMSIIPLASAYFILKFKLIPSVYIIPALVFISIGSARLLYKTGIIGKK